MPWLSKLAFTAIILSWLSQCMAQTSSYLLSRNQTFYNILPILQIGDLQFFNGEDSASAFNYGTITTYNLTSGQISTFPGNINCPTNGSMFLDGTTVYCVTIQNVLQLDPLNSMEQIADYGAPTPPNSTLSEYYKYSINSGSVLFYNEDETDFDIFNTSINQFTCQFSTTEKQNIDSIFPYGGGYLVANGSNTTYYSCNGAPLIDFGEVGKVQFLLNSSSIMIAGTNNAITALSANQNKTGPALLVENLGMIADSVGQVNDTHFIIATQTDNIYTLKLYTTNSDLELIQCASSIQIPIPNSYFYQFNLVPGTNLTLLDIFAWGLIDLESFTLSQIQGSLGQVTYPPILLSNGSILEFSDDTYYIFSGDALLISGSYNSYYIDPTNADFVWILLENNANVLMIQISTSMPTTFPLELGDDEAWTILSASYDGADEYNFTLFVDTGVYYDTAVVVFTSGIQQAAISVENSNFISATNYQEGSLHYISTSSDGIIHEVYDFYNGYQIQGATRIISGSLTNIAKINDNYVIMTNSTTSTEIFVYSISESQFVYSQSFPVQKVNQIVPLGINLTTDSIAQGFAILSTNYQAYSAFDAQGNQLDSITFPFGYKAQLQALSNTSIALLVNTTLSNPYNYVSVYQYTGSMETVSDAAPAPNASSKVKLSYLLLVMLIIEYFMI